MPPPLQVMVEERGGALYSTDDRYCIDNGAMIAWPGLLALKQVGWLACASLAAGWAGFGELGVGLGCAAAGVSLARAGCCRCALGASGAGPKDGMWWWWGGGAERFEGNNTRRFLVC